LCEYEFGASQDNLPALLAAAYRKSMIPDARVIPEPHYQAGRA
jgi:hypothetical protein